MRVGLGITALRINLKAGRRDGIGTYCLALTRSLQKQFPEREFCEVAFNISRGWLLHPVQKYEICAATSALLGVRYQAGRLFGTDFDVFHALDHHIPNLTTPVIATLHDAGPLSNPELWPGGFRYLKNLMYAAKCRFPRRVIAVSKYTADEVVRYAGVESGNVDVIYEGVGDHILAESRAPLDWGQMKEMYGLRPGFIAYCGSISKKKNIANLLAAHEALPGKLQAEHPLVLIGGIPAKEQMHDVVAAIRVGERRGTVKWLGSLPDSEMARILHHSEVFAFPSLHEGFGLPVVEAFQLGIPVLTSNVASLPEIAGDSAVLVDPRDCRVLSRELERLLGDRVLRGELSERGKARAAMFSWQKCAKLTVEAYERVLA